MYELYILCIGLFAGATLAVLAIGCLRIFSTGMPGLDGVPERGLG